MHWTATTKIDARPETVWAALVDIVRWPDWSESMTKVEPLNTGGLRVGSKARVTQPRLGRNLWEVTEVDAGRAFSWQSRRPGVLTVATHQIATPHSDFVTVTLGIEQTGPLSPVLGRLLGRLTARYLETEAAGLKKQCEGA